MQKVPAEPAKLWSELYGQDSGEWRWQTCRALGFRISAWVWPWRKPSLTKHDDKFGGSICLSLGPVDFELLYNVGEKRAEEMSKFSE